MNYVISRVCTSIVAAFLWRWVPRHRDPGFHQGRWRDVNLRTVQTCGEKWSLAELVFLYLPLSRLFTQVSGFSMCNFLKTCKRINLGVVDILKNYVIYKVVIQNIGLSLKNKMNVNLKINLLKKNSLHSMHRFPFYLIFFVGWN